MLNARANLLLITFDQWRGDWAQPQNPFVSLPTLERLAKRSMVFRRCYTSSPQCVPARLSWLTGLSPSQLGITKNCAVEAPEDSPSLFREMQHRGWYTELIGKTHWTNHRDATDLRKTESLIQQLGFDKVTEIAGPKALRHVKCELTDEWEKNGMMGKYIEDMSSRYGSNLADNAWMVKPSILPDHLYPDNWIANRGVQALERMPTEQPWLLWISFVGPHEPFDTPETWANTDEPNLPEPIPRAEWIKELPADCELQKSALRWSNRLKPSAIEALRIDYRNHVQLLDKQLERLTKQLDKRNDSGNTAIAITSDHGEMLGDHGMLYKGTFLESSIQVPFQYCPPPNERFGGMELNRPVELTPLLKTILETVVQAKNASEVKKFANRTSHAVVEFGDELLIIKNHKKICYKLTGEALWATRMNRDTKEQKNKLDKYGSKRNTKWHTIMEIAQQEIRKRRHSGWMWRNIRHQGR